MEVSEVSFAVADSSAGDNSSPHDKSQCRDIIELPTVSNYTNGFLETITEEGSEFETSEDGSALDTNSETHQTDYHNSYVTTPTLGPDHAMIGEVYDSDDYEEMLTQPRIGVTGKIGSTRITHYMTNHGVDNNHTEHLYEKSSVTNAVSKEARNFLPSEMTEFMQPPKKYTKNLPSNGDVSLTSNQYNNIVGKHVMDNFSSSDKPYSDITNEPFEEYFAGDESIKNKQWCWTIENKQPNNTLLPAYGMPKNSELNHLTFNSFESNLYNPPLALQTKLIVDQAEGRKRQQTIGSARLHTINVSPFTKSLHVHQSTNVVQQSTDSSDALFSKCGHETNAECAELLISPKFVPQTQKLHANMLPREGLCAGLEETYKRQVGDQSSKNTKYPLASKPADPITCEHSNIHSGNSVKSHGMCSTNGHSSAQQATMSTFDDSIIHCSASKQSIPPLHSTGFKQTSESRFNTPPWSSEPKLVQQHMINNKPFTDTLSEILSVPATNKKGGITRTCTFSPFQVDEYFVPQTQLYQSLKRNLCSIPPDCTDTNGRQSTTEEAADRRVKQPDSVHCYHAQRRRDKLKSDNSCTKVYYRGYSLEQPCTQTSVDETNTVIYPHDVTLISENQLDCPMKMEFMHPYEPIISKILHAQSTVSTRGSSPVWIANSTPKIHMDRKFPESRNDSALGDTSEMREGVADSNGLHEGDTESMHSLLRPLHRSPAVLGVSDLLLKTDEELKEFMMDASVKTSSEKVRLPVDKINRQDSCCPTEHSPVRRRFDMHCNRFAEDAVVDGEGDTPERRSFFDYGEEDDEDDDIVGFNFATNSGSNTCPSPIQAPRKYAACETRKVVSTTETQLFNMPYEEASRILDDILKVNTDDKSFLWTDNCHSYIAERGDAELIPTRVQITNVRRNVLDSWDLPFIDSDPAAVEQGQKYANYQPALADIDEITLTSRNSYIRNSWGSAADLNCMMCQPNGLNPVRRSPTAYYRNCPQSGRVKRVRIHSGLTGPKTEDTVRVSGTTKTRRGYFPWLRRLCGCVRTPRFLKTRHC